MMLVRFLDDAAMERTYGLWEGSISEEDLSILPSQSTLTSPNSNIASLLVNLETMRNPSSIKSEE
jgi:hypothetical protein